MSQTNNTDKDNENKQLIKNKTASENSDNLKNENDKINNDKIDDSKENKNVNEANADKVYRQRLNKVNSQTENKKNKSSEKSDKPKLNDINNNEENKKENNEEKIKQQDNKTESKDKKENTKLNDKKSENDTVADSNSNVNVSDAEKSTNKTETSKKTDIKTDAKTDIKTNEKTDEKNESKNKDEKIEQKDKESENKETKDKETKDKDSEEKDGKSKTKTKKNKKSKNKDEKDKETKEEQQKEEKEEVKDEAKDEKSDNYTKRISKAYEAKMSKLTDEFKAKQDNEKSFVKLSHKKVEKLAIYKPLEEGESSDDTSLEDEEKITASKSIANKKKKDKVKTKDKDKEKDKVEVEEENNDKTKDSDNKKDNDKSKDKIIDKDKDKEKDNDNKSETPKAKSSHRNNHVMGSIVSVVFGCVVIAIIYYATTRAFDEGNNLIKTQEQMNTQYTYIAEEDTPISDAIKVLVKNNIISSKVSADLEVKLQGASDFVVPQGKYYFEGKMPTKEVIRVLTTERDANSLLAHDEIAIVITPGLSLKNIAQYLETIEFCTKKEFNSALLKEYDYEFLEKAPGGKKHLEGYLMPGTYIVDRDKTPEELVELMLQGFDDFYEETYKAELAKKDIKVQKAVTKASLLQEELTNAEYYGSLSSLIDNRIQKNMNLELVSTIEYATNKNKNFLKDSDFKEDSKYNTFTESGYPKGPICTVSEEALLAAINPDDTNYLYFFEKKDSTAYFTDDEKSYKKELKKDK